MIISEMGEDCLTLNVWSPALSSRDRLPVMVSIHGGGFYGGASGDRRVDERALARQGVVVVTIQYRLGVFGFFAHPALSKESPNGVSGNYGLMDQIAALQWVKDNIASFGGDPARVTIFGSSAGGCSVLYLMASPLARGLFAHGIAESSARVYYPFTVLRERRYGREPAEATGLRLGADIAALRALPPQDLLTRSDMRMNLMFGDTGNEYWPMVDGWVLPEEPMIMFETGRAAQLPLIIGTTTDEATLFASRGVPTTVAAWRDFVSRRHPGAEAAVLSAYAAETDAEVYQAAVRLINDWQFHGTARAVARAVSARRQPVYLYHFSRVPPRQPIPGRNLGAYHSAELQYVFGAITAFTETPVPWEAVDHELASTMSAAWVRFAKTGNPNGPGLTEWPRYEVSTDRHLEFGTQVKAGSGLHASSLDAFDQALAQMRAADRKARSVDR
jgi:para-nitrobenzyl esterase